MTAVLKYSALVCPTRPNPRFWNVIEVFDQHVLSNSSFHIMPSGIIPDTDDTDVGFPDQMKMVYNWILQMLEYAWRSASNDIVEPLLDSSIVKRSHGTSAGGRKRGATAKGSYCGVESLSAVELRNDRHGAHIAFGRFARNCETGAGSSADMSDMVSGRLR
jgi:hypothetical protein